MSRFYDIKVSKAEAERRLERGEKVYAKHVGFALEYEIAAIHSYGAETKQGDLISPEGFYRKELA